MNKKLTSWGKMFLVMITCSILIIISEGNGYSVEGFHFGGFFLGWSITGLIYELEKSNYLPIK